jgi:putative transposase
MTNDHRNRLIERVRQLSPERLAALERLLAEWERTDTLHRDWPHAPTHRLSEHGTFLVTAGTLYKEHHFRTPQRLGLLQAKLLELARQYGWQLEA